MKRLIALGDTHCGHFAGLTPPGWQFSKTGHRKETAKQQRETWNWFAKEVKPLAGADVAIWNGDLIDGQCIGWTKRTDSVWLRSIGQDLSGMWGKEEGITKPPPKQGPVF